MTRTIPRARVDQTAFNSELELPYALRIQDLKMAMEDVYDFLHDVNNHLVSRSLLRLEQMVCPASLSGILSDMLTGSLANHSRALTENRHFNGHPDLVVGGMYPEDDLAAGKEGVEVKCTKKRGGAVDMHGARDQWLCVFVYEVDGGTEPAVARRPPEFVEVYLARVRTDDFRRNRRGELGTRTATLHRGGMGKLRQGWVYRK